MSCDRRARAPDLVEVVEGGTVLIELLLADALSIARQDLVLNLVDGSGDGGQQLLPADTEMLQGGGEGAQKKGGEARDTGSGKEIKASGGSGNFVFQRNQSILTQRIKSMCMFTKVPVW